MPAKKWITKRDAERMDRNFRRAAEGALLLRQENETGKLTFKEMTRKERAALKSYYSVRAGGITFIGLLVSAVLSFIAYTINYSFSLSVFFDRYSHYFRFGFVFIDKNSRRENEPTHPY